MRISMISTAERLIKVEDGKKYNNFGKITKNTTDCQKKKSV